MSAASFVHANGRVDFSRAPLRPDNSLAPRQPQRKTAGGVRKSYTALIEDDLMTIVLRMTDGERDQFISFWNAVVNGMVEPFTYNPVVGSPVTVCFNTPELPDLSDKAFNSNTVTVVLRKL